MLEDDVEKADDVEECATTGVVAVDDEEVPLTTPISTHWEVFKFVQYEFSCAAVAELRTESAEDAMKERMERVSM